MFLFLGGCFVFQFSVAVFCGCLLCACVLSVFLFLCFFWCLVSSFKFQGREETFKEQKVTRKSDFKFQVSSFMGEGEERERRGRGGGEGEHSSFQVSGFALGLGKNSTKVIEITLTTKQKATKMSVQNHFSASPSKSIFKSIFKCIFRNHFSKE